MNVLYLMDVSCLNFIFSQDPKIGDENHLGLAQPLQVQVCVEVFLVYRFGNFSDFDSPPSYPSKNCRHFPSNEWNVRYCFDDSLKRKAKLQNFPEMDYHALQLPLQLFPLVVKLHLRPGEN